MDLIGQAYNDFGDISLVQRVASLGHLLTVFAEIYDFTLLRKLDPSHDSATKLLTSLD